MVFKTYSTGWTGVFLLLCFIVSCSALRQYEFLTTKVQTKVETEMKLPDDSKLESFEDEEFELEVKVPSDSKLESVKSTEWESCEEVYGIFPCSTTSGGNLILMIGYGFFLLKAAEWLATGSELLLAVSHPGIIGGLVLPILSSVPDSLLILSSGMSGSAEAAQSQVLLGIGLLAGSNIMLLTVLWGGSLLVGRNDLEMHDGILEAKERSLTKGWSLMETGVTTDQQTRVASWIMIATVLPYLVAQVPVTVGLSKSTGLIFILMGCITSLLGLAIYCTYQIVSPWIQKRSIYRAKRKAQRAQALHKISLFSHNNSLGSLLENDGETPNRKLLDYFFNDFDKNKDGFLSIAELEGLIIAININFTDEEVARWMKEFDKDQDGVISREEFVGGTTKWIRSTNSPSRRRRRRRTTAAMAEAAGLTPSTVDAKPHLLWKSVNKEAEMDLQALLSDQAAEDDEDEENSPPQTKTQVIILAVGHLVGGVVLAGILSNPLVTAIGNFSTATGISPFFIAFVATPLATNSSEAMSSLKFAMRKKKKNISMTYSQIYGSVTMNNTLCLAVFLAVVHSRGLTWDFSSEVMVILLTTIVIGSLASVRVTFPSWMAIVALLLYPISLALVAFFDRFYNWE